MEEYSTPTFSIHDYDRDGDIVDFGIFLHYEDTRIKISDSLSGFRKHIEHLIGIQREIDENYHV